MGVSSAEHKETPATTCSILLVEDNKINQKVVCLMLGKFGIVPVIAESGQQAIDAVQDQPFDLVLMDLHMPGMDGMEAATRIKGILGEASPPIVALTADAMRCESEEFRKYGLDGCMTKPINAGILKGCIEQYTSFRL